MKKSDIAALPRFFGWLDFTRLVEARGAGRKAWKELAPPRHPGVYVFATLSAQRTRGDSDIFYIGKADNLSNRVGKYVNRVQRSAQPELYDGYVGNPLAPEQGITSLVEAGQAVEIGWVVTESAEPAYLLEKNLLDAYMTEHDQFPPNNRVGGRRL